MYRVSAREPPPESRLFTSAGNGLSLGMTRLTSSASKVVSAHCETIFW